MGSPLHSEVARGPVRNFLNISNRPTTNAMGFPTPFNSDLSGSTFVFEEPRFRTLLLGKVLMRLTRNVGMDILPPRMPGARALAFRRLSARDSACIAILMNHTFSGMTVGYAYSFTPFLRRVAKNDGIRVTAPYANSHPDEWIVTFADRPFLPRRERIPSFLIDASHGAARGAFLCGAEVSYFSCLHTAQLPMGVRSKWPWRSNFPHPI